MRYYSPAGGRLYGQIYTPGQTVNTTGWPKRAIERAIDRGLLAVDLPAQAGSGFTDRGAWAPSTAYAVDDIVSHGGSTYRVHTAHTSGASFDATNLRLWAKAGDPGPTGAAGPAGATGATGPQGPAGTMPNRATVTLTGPGSGLVTIADGYRLLRIETNAAARLRLYDSAANRDADAARAAGTDPSNVPGLFLDYSRNAAGAWSFTPQVYGFTLDGTASVPYIVDASAAVSITLLYVDTEG